MRVEILESRRRMFEKTSQIRFFFFFPSTTLGQAAVQEEQAAGRGGVGCSMFSRQIQLTVDAPKHK